MRAPVAMQHPVSLPPLHAKSTCCCRKVRAQCVRNFKPGPNTPLNNYYRNFKGLCKRAQAQPVSKRDRRSDEDHFERGCARMVFAAAAPTFARLLRMRVQSRCATVCSIALHAHF